LFSLEQNHSLSSTKKESLSKFSIVQLTNKHPIWLCAWAVNFLFFNKALVKRNT
jgi:hypothetical protein